MTYLSGLPNMADTMYGCIAPCAEHPDRRYHTKQSSLPPAAAWHHGWLADFIKASNLPPAIQ
jgi:hypothetical protein